MLEPGMDILVPKTSDQAHYFSLIEPATKLALSCNPALLLLVKRKVRGKVRCVNRKADDIKPNSQ
jgi:hypothetical protein